MRMGIALCLLALASLGLAGAAHAQRSYDIMIEEGGRRPARKPAPKPVEPADGEVKQQAKPRKAYPRGSSSIPPANLPRTEAITVPQAPGVYRPPPINSYGDRVRNCIHSYPLNAGIGNNPTDQSSYVRQCAN